MNVNITILYGSETGTAQDVAEQIWKGAKRKGLHSTVCAMDDYDVQNLGFEKLIIFVVATTGQGEPPKNMRKFWKLLLRKHLSATTLISLRYGVLGLGDSSYQKFNYAAKKLNKRLIQLGAKELVDIGLADDQHDLGIDAVVDSWLHELWTNISGVFLFPETTSVYDQNGVIERFSISHITDTKVNQASLNADIFMYELSTRDELKSGTIIYNTRTTSTDHFQDVRLIKMRSSGIQYEPGDVVYFRPKNSIKQTEKFFEVLKENNVNFDPDMIIKVGQKELKVPYVLEQPLTLRQVVEQYWDLSFKPRRSTMQTLSLISENELEKEKLHEFTTASAQEELYSYINRPRRNILEVLADFPHTTSKLTLQLLFEIMSPIKPRAFSIASSIKNTKDEIHILVAVVKYKTKLMEPRIGLCSNWLASLRDGDKVIFWLEKGTFKFQLEKPMILIGPGTGIAPFRSLLLERAVLDKDLSNCALFFGCRNKDKDYHCQNDFELLVQEKHLKLFCAFSRDQERKIYVQHVICNEKALCWDLLCRGGCVYLAGNSKNMPDCVREEFICLIQEGGQLTKKEAEDFVLQMEKTNRYQTETWG